MKNKKYLKSAFPDMKGFAFRNLKYMVYFAKAYPDFKIRQQPVAQIPWGHNILLLQKLETIEDRLIKPLKMVGAGIVYFIGSTATFISAKVRRLIIFKMHLYLLNQI